MKALCYGLAYMMWVSHRHGVAVGSQWAARMLGKLARRRSQLVADAVVDARDRWGA